MCLVLRLQLTSLRISVMRLLTTRNRPETTVDTYSIDVWNIKCPKKLIAICVMLLCRPKVGRPVPELKQTNSTACVVCIRNSLRIPQLYEVDSTTINDWCENLHAQRWVHFFSGETDRSIGIFFPAVCRMCPSSLLLGGSSEIFIKLEVCPTDNPSSVYTSRTVPSRWRHLKHVVSVNCLLHLHFRRKTLVSRRKRQMSNQWFISRDRDVGAVVRDACRPSFSSIGRSTVGRYLSNCRRNVAMWREASTSE